jgi:type IV pilus assembly protein PilY1
VQHPSADFTNTTAVTAAYYYVFDSTLANCDGTKTDEDCYKLVTVSATSGPGGTDERQNFANWYSFYRTRNLLTVTAAARAFAQIPDGKVRLAWQALNKCNSFGTGCQGWTTTTYDNRIRTYQGSHRTNFYNWLFRLPASGGTPLRSGLKRAGEYFGTSGINSPYAFDPQVTANPEYSCRPNFSIVMTDGIWNDNLTGYGNADNTSKGLPDGKAYTPIAPYRDGNSNSLADIAFHYWSNDLRTDLDNNVVPYMPERTGNATQQYWNPKNDPATWQHMVTFTMGLGLTGSLGNHWTGDTHGGPFYAGLLAGSMTWPSTGANTSPGNVYDLWHAAINTRGRFFSAEDPDALVAAFQETLNRVLERQSSASALATNSTRLSTETVVFQARFNSADWSGQLLAIPLNSDGSIGTVLWDAAEKIPAAAARNIKIWNGTSGVDFDWGSLSVIQQGQLGSAAMVDYLRGDATGEVKNGGSFRNRDKVLGDIVNSDPVFVGSQNFGYDILPSTEGATYKSFLATKASVPKMLYVGANDGMLHGFDASTGVERLAYVPAAVFADLPQLSNPAYAHKYYVDGSPWVGDAYFDGAWHSVLVGSTGAGGKAVFALDVSNPASFSASDVLWEFTHPQLGYTIGQPMIARLNNGRWAAVFGNGYDSTGGTAKLFIVFLDANAADGWHLGTDYMVFDTNTTTANGLSSPTLYDQNGDRIVDYVYAGDLQGNVWKFDLSNSNSSQWKIANKSGSTFIPFFTARSATNQVQPITGPIEIGPAPPGKAGVMLYFGTGRFFAVGDNTNTQVQTFYALWDSYTNNNQITYSCSSGSCNRDTALQAQTILYEGPGSGTHSVRVISSNTVDYSTRRGWYLDLLPPSGTAKGERVVTAPLLRHGRVIFTTLIPSSDPCKFGGDSWIMELAANTGGRLDYSAFDLNDDDLFNASDYVTVTIGGVSQTVPVSGMASKAGIIKTPTVISAGEKEYKLASGTTGEIASVKEKGGGAGFGRVSWQELFTE